MANYEDVFKKIVAHAKEYGFIFQSSELYDGLAAVYDYGPNGVELKNNIKNYWWKSMVNMNENIVGLDSAIFMHPTTWKASGHVDAFNGNNGRLLSVVLYLNDNWQSEWGGRLRIWPEADATCVATEVEPRAGTLVAFLSEKIPHEVLAATRERYSIAGWFRCNNTTADWLDPPR